MQAVVITEFGGPDVLRTEERPDPRPAPGEVVLQVAAAGVNRADLLQREGHYAPPPGAPEWPGLECSGTVAELGEGVTDWAVGDQACALLAGGGYATRVAVPAGQLLPIPDGVSLVDAAALPEVACTVWSNVFMTAGLQPGEVLLVHGGSSGIGTMAIQLGRELGATVAVTAGSAAKLEACAGLGASILVNYRDEDFVAAVQEATDGRGADVVLDNMGAKYLDRNLRVLATNGRLVVIGMQGGTKAEIDLGRLLYKRAALIATSLRSRPAGEKAAITASTREHVWPLLSDGRVRPVIHRRVPMSEVAEAHRILDRSDHIGKVVLEIG